MKRLENEREDEEMKKRRKRERQDRVAELQEEINAIKKRIELDTQEAQHLEYKKQILLKLIDDGAGTSSLAPPEEHREVGCDIIPPPNPFGLMKRCPLLP